MMVQKHITLIIFFISVSLYSQIKLDKPNYIKNIQNTILANHLNRSLDELFLKLSTNESIEDLIYTTNKKLTISTLNLIKDYHFQFQNDSLSKINHQLINVFPTNKDTFKLKLSGVLMRDKVTPVLLYNI